MSTRSYLTSRPMEVRLMLSSWFCRPKLPATSTTIWRHVQGIVGRKSVTTNCRHWKAVRINDSLKGNKTRGGHALEFSFLNYWQYNLRNRHLG